MASLEALAEMATVANLVPLEQLVSLVPQVLGVHLEL